MSQKRNSVASGAASGSSIVSMRFGMRKMSDSPKVMIITASRTRTYESHHTSAPNRSDSLRSVRITYGRARWKMSVIAQSDGMNAAIVATSHCCPPWTSACLIASAT